jgi:hypothetical protein
MLKMIFGELPSLEYLVECYGSSNARTTEGDPDVATNELARLAAAIERQTGADGG